MAVLSLGSNMGRREDAILGAVDRLRLKTSVDVRALSSLYETEPVGEGFSRNFINAVCVISTVSTPLGLLEICEELEIGFGRKVKGEKGDRVLDIDIVCYGTLVVDEPDLRIPHPEFRKRPFVLVPLIEVAPDMRVPPGCARVRDIFGRLNSKHWVRKISSRNRIY